MNQKPYNFLLWLGLVLALSSFFITDQNSTLDIHLHDTYFVMYHNHILWLLAILALLVWTLYFLTSKLLYSKKLTLAHVMITILTLLLSGVTIVFGDSSMNPRPLRYDDYSNWNTFHLYPLVANIMGITIMVFLLGQLIFVINVMAGIFKRITNHS